MTIKSITSAANPLIKKIRGLALKKNRDEEGLFLVEGARHVAEALDSGWTPEIVAFSAAAADAAAIAGRCGSKTICFETTDEILSRVTQRDNAEELIGVFLQKWHVLPEIGDGLWICLEGIRDPGNLGTIIRTADAVGARGVVLVGETCDPYAPAVVRATVGSFARVPLFRTALPQFLAWRKEWNGRLIGTALVGAQDYRSLSYSLPLMLVMGTEQSGLSRDMIGACDALAKIPMADGAESLNLAVSTGIMLYEICRESL